ncbi:hypothetical protein [Nocardia arthritidis]|uniref:DUF3168 domain-containing protein n=1 Tax=Nocardia arthritidis TaxID=228602 RepID=A0A6G9YT72_9NOCA|nr:hypothetical protein [Nocardia arthritidis]QIS16412.1 hypothetical protein F5544_43020 [Nocardia arthritidis]
MVELVVFPDAESIVVSYLSAQLAVRGDKALVTRVIPDSPPSRMVRVKGFWGSDRGLVLASRLITVQCADVTPSGAADLAELCFAILRAARHDPTVPAIQGVDSVDAVTLDRSALRLPEPTPARPNYQFTVSLTLRGKPR